QALKRAGMECVRQRECSSTGPIPNQAGDRRNPARVPGSRYRRAGPPRKSDDAARSSAAVVRTALVAGTPSRVLARSGIRVRRGGATPEASGPRTRDGFGGDVVLADHASSGLYKSQAQEALAGLRRVLATESDARACRLSACAADLARISP